MRTLSVRVHQIHFPLQSLLVSITLSHDPQIYQTVPTIFFHDCLHSIQRETRGIDSEVFVVQHVVNVTPDSIERDLVLLEVLQDCFEVGYVFVTPAGLLEP